MASQQFPPRTCADQAATRAGTQMLRAEWHQAMPACAAAAAAATMTCASSSSSTRGSSRRIKLPCVTFNSSRRCSGARSGTRGKVRMARRLPDQGLTLCASPAYLPGAPAQPQDLAHHDCLVFTYPCRHRVALGRTPPALRHFRVAPKPWWPSAARSQSTTATPGAEPCWQAWAWSSCRTSRWPKTSPRPACSCCPPLTRCSAARCIALRAGPRALTQAQGLYRVCAGGAWQRAGHSWNGSNRVGPRHLEPSGSAGPRRMHHRSRWLDLAGPASPRASPPARTGFPVASDRSHPITSPGAVKWTGQ